MKYGKSRLIICLGVLMNLFCYQDIRGQDNDMGTWLGVNISGDITKKFGVELEEEVRIFKNFGEIDRFSSEIDAFYVVNKYLKGGIGYGWIYDHDVNDSFWENRHRLFAYVRGKAEVGRFTATLREKFQSTTYDKDLKGFDYSPKYYLRSRLGLEYDIKGCKAAPYLALEMHLQLNNPDGNEIDNWRYSLGAEFPIAKNLSLDTFFRLSHDVNVRKPDNLWLIGVSLNWDMKRQKQPVL